ncbi:hypothetical protein MXB_352 [Myxobolus squamalis]|nr:hypothetical protein MXB_352 [Myxobolus squamalis]
MIITWTLSSVSNITANQINLPIVASGITLNVFNELPDISRLSSFKDNISNISDKSSIEQKFEFGSINYDPQPAKISVGINEGLVISPSVHESNEIDKDQENGINPLHVLNHAEKPLKTIDNLPSIFVESASSLKSETCELFPLNNKNIQISASTSALESLPASIGQTSRFLENFNTAAVLHGMIKIEKISDVFIIKIRVIEAINLRPIGLSTTISSYVVCQVMSQTERIFKEKTSTVKDCSAPVKKPVRSKSFKSMLKKDKTDNNIFGSVRIGGANYLSQEEKDIWEKLKNHLNNAIIDWIDFKIELKYVEAIDSGSSRQISTITSPANIDAELVSLPESKSRKNSDDTTSFFSISSSYYDDSTITGLLTIFLKYSQQKQVLTVTFVKAQRLICSKNTSNSKVFAKCKMVPRSTENDTKTTTMSTNPYEPEWNSTFIFKINLAVLCDTNLIANVYRVESILSNKFIGQVVIPIEAIIDSSAKELVDGFCDEYPLTLKVPMGSYGFKGIISLSLRFDPTSYDGHYGNLEGRILKAMDLPLDSKNSLPDTYVIW